MYLFTAPRSTAACPGPNNLPPLGFHSEVHGDNIRISRDGTTAKRFESFCKGITFSSRPVRINERVCIRFAEISNNWSGVIRFGFTYNDPVMLRNALPKYACPELTNKPGYWAKALNERFCERDNILFFYVTSSGDVHFGVNGEDKGVFITGVDTRSPLWAIIDVYGNCTSIEFLDSRIYMAPSQNYNMRRRSTPAEAEVDNIIPAVQNMAIQDTENVPTPPPALMYNNNAAPRLVPVPFHRTKGRNIRLSNDHCIATRLDTEFCQGYVFTARPLRIGEKLIVHILRTECMYVGALALGLTSCDPATLGPSDLPDDSDLLLDRPEYWVVSKDVASTPQRGDEITFCVTPNGEVQISKNNTPPTVVMHVDQSLQLWAFLDVYGSTQSVRILSQPPSPGLQSQMSTSPRRLQVSLPGSESINSMNSINSINSMNIQNQQQQAALAQEVRKMPAVPASRVISVPSNEMIQLQPGGTVLVVNLPPTHQQDMSGGIATPRIAQVPMPSASCTPGTSSAMMSKYSHSYIEVIIFDL